MEKTVNQRLKKFVESKDFPAKEFAERFGATDKEINNWTTSTKIALPRLSQLILAYPELNVRWLLTGQGKMTDENENLTKEPKQLYNTCPLCKEKDRSIHLLEKIVSDLEAEKEQLTKACSDKEELLDWYKGKKETAPENSAQHGQAANE
jgi:hypothetical protein